MDCDACFFKFEAATPLPLDCPRCGRCVKKKQSKSRNESTTTTATDAKLSMPPLQAKASVPTRTPVPMHAGLAEMLQTSSVAPPLLGVTLGAPLKTVAKTPLASLVTGGPLPELLFDKPATINTNSATTTTTGLDFMYAKPSAKPDLVFGRPVALSANNGAAPKTVGALLDSMYGTPYDGAQGLSAPLPNLEFGKHCKNHGKHGKQDKREKRDTPVELNEEGLPVEMFGSASDALQRLGLEQHYMTRIESPALRALMQTGSLGTSYLSTGCAADVRESPACAQAHLKTCHAPFYALLERDGLLAELRAAGCVLFVVPYHDMLNSQAMSSDALRQHLARTPDDMDLLALEKGQVLQLATFLPGRSLQLEQRDGRLYVNGYAAKPDERYPAHIVHIGALLAGGLPEPQVAPPDAPDGQEVEGELSVTKVVGEGVEDSNPDLPPPSDAPPVYVEQETLQSTSSVMNACSPHGVFGHTALGQLVEKMNGSHYAGSIDLSSYRNTDRSDAAQPVTLRLCHYDTAQAYAAYQRQALPGLARLKATSVLEMRFRAGHQTHLQFGQGMELAEYTCRHGGAAVLPTRAQLESGLVTLSFSSPFDAKDTTLLLTRLQSTSQDRNTYMAVNEAVLLRFEQDTLHTIVINHKHQMPSCATAGLQHSFLELATAALPQGLSATEFDALWLGEGVVKRLVRKGKKAAISGVRQAKNYVQDKQKRVLSLRLRPVPNPAVLDAALRPPGVPTPGSASVVVYGSKMAVDEDASVQHLAMKRYSGAVSVYELGTNRLGAVARRPDTHVMDVTLGVRKVSLGVDDVTDTALYYAQDADQVYVVQLEGDALRRIAVLSSKSGLYTDLKRA